MYNISVQLSIEIIFRDDKSARMYLKIQLSLRKKMKQ